MSASDRIAALAMYDAPAAVAAANDALWAGLRDRLRAAGIADVPDRADARRLLCRPVARPAPVAGADLRLSLRAPPAGARCGWWRRRSTASRAAPEPSDGASSWWRPAPSFAHVAEVRGARAAINDPGSNSGANLFAALVAPLAVDGRFFSSVTVTGSHRESLAAVAAGRADVAAIDSVTFGLLARHAPEEVAGVRVLCETPGGPGLPLIARGAATDREVAMLREALADMVADPGAGGGARGCSGSSGSRVLGDEDYEVLARYAADAAARGYRELSASVSAHESKARRDVPTRPLRGRVDARSAAGRGDRGREPAHDLLRSRRRRSLPPPPGGATPPRRPPVADPPPQGAGGGVPRSGQGGARQSTHDVRESRLVREARPKIA